MVYDGCPKCGDHVSTNGEKANCTDCGWFGSFGAVGDEVRADGGERDIELAREAETPVYYVPGAANHYDPVEDVIVIDENLKEYELAHQLILSHEQEHAKKDSAVEWLWLDLRSDFRQLFSYDPAIRQARQYIDDRPVPPAKYAASNMVRELFRLPLTFLSGFVLGIARTVERPEEVASDA
jgi:hypothetical protein